MPEATVKVISSLWEELNKAIKLIENLEDVT